MRSKNTCKTCAVGMGGQLGGMVNEGGYFPEVCKKSFQAMASDLQGAIPTRFLESIQRQPVACDDVATAGTLWTTCGTRAAGERSDALSPG